VQRSHIDDFKKINDTHGHHIGDELLTLVSVRISRQLRQSDLIARLGGDEFVVLLREAKDEESIASIVTALIEHMSVPYNLKVGMTHVNVSIGISIFPNHASNIDDLLQKADVAMYEAKKMGKNTWSIFKGSST